MKILIVSDLIDPFIYNYTIKDTFKDIDCVLCAGDLPMDYIDFIVSTLNKPTYFIFGNHNLKEFKYFHSYLPKDSQTVCTDSHTHGALYAGFKVITDRQLKWTLPGKNRETPLLIAGVSGSKDYNHGLNQYSELAMKFKLIQMIPKLIMNKILYGRYLDIFLTHATPRHVHDHEDNCHQGFRCFNWFVKKFKPVYMVHGHIHLYDLVEPRISVYEKTVVVNAYGHYVIDLPVLDISKIPVIKIKD
ncbi:MAG: metallophosphoesterase [Treponema sp.]|uniref:metallophosphoesterase n=1 Tax=Treponema sp. TaxID=166 RepID=UPI001B441F31|nr:metallophosphoesterase [Treponema sp.]MBP5403110.1 metallophosphoesterase [Treponema sp.]MBR5934329.1 metallophosphoesterase [Treponema sp.]